MKWVLLTFRSVTLAQRGERVLRRAGIESTVMRAPRWMEERGCGYSLKLRRRDLNAALDLLDEAGLAYRKIYEQLPNGDWEERK